MRVIPPLAITPARLSSSTVAEPDTGEAAYNPATTYALGAEVISTTTHRTYVSLLGSNVGNPLPVSPEISTLYWLDTGPTNRYRMFDLVRNTQTVGTSPLTVVVTPGMRIDSLALVGLEANALTISVSSGGEVIYTRSVNLNTRIVTGWLDWFTVPFTTRPAVAYFDLPLRTDSIITITLTSTSGTVKCGGVVIGRNVYLGQTQYSAVSDTINLSKITRNENTGEVLLSKRRSIPTTVQTVWCEKSNVNSARAARDDLNAEPALWLWLDDVEDLYFDAGLILGIYRRFSISLDHPTHAVISLEIEEV